MQSNIPLPVPSTPLLRFLRSQTFAGTVSLAPEVICCPATPSPRCCPYRPYHHSRQNQTNRLHCQSRGLSTSLIRQDPASPATLESSSILEASILGPLLGRRPSHTGTSPTGQGRVIRALSKESGTSPEEIDVQHLRETYVNGQGRRIGYEDEYDTTDEQRRANILERLLGPRLPPHHPSHIYDEPGFAPRRSVTAKAALEPRLRCTEMDENGEFTIVDGEFKKTELIAKYGLLPRDLRKIDSSNLPHILVRESAILLNLLHLKVLIKHDRVLLFDLYGSETSYSQSSFVNELQAKLKLKPSSAGGLPYEFRALEVVLTSVTAALEADFETVRVPIMNVLSELEDDIDRGKLRELLIYSKRVSTFEQRAKLVRDAIDELLEANDDLAAMYLTEKANKIKRGEDDHTEVEMLLESYHKLCDEIYQEAGNLVSSIRNTEEIVRAILDANRNALMLLDLKFSVGTLGLAMGTFIAGLYGMNLKNFLEESILGFWGITSTSVVCSILVCSYGLIKLRKVQRIKMSMSDTAGAGCGGRAHVTGDEATMKLLEGRNKERFRRQRSAAERASKSARARAGRGVRTWWML